MAVYWIDKSFHRRVIQGQDIFAAIALGAKAVFIRRAYLYGIMANEERGVEKAIKILRKEFLNTMVLTGNRSLDEVRACGAIMRAI